MPTRRCPFPLLCLLVASACQTARAGLSITLPEAKAVLDLQAARWNEGDLKGFVASYWDGPELTFLGSGGLTRGPQDLLANYQRGYPTAERRGVLTFEVLEFRPLGDGHALLLGRYHLQRTPPASGFFSLVLVRRDGGVVILHDHTSETPPPK